MAGLLSNQTLILGPCITLVHNEHLSCNQRKLQLFFKMNNDHAVEGQTMGR